jgi:hypothetical protein
MGGGAAPAAADPTAAGTTPAASGIQTPLGNIPIPGMGGAATPASATPAAATATAQPAAATTLSPADAAARADILALQTALTAKQYKPAITQIQNLQAIEKNGVNKTTLSPAMKTVTDQWIAGGTAQIKLAVAQSKIGALHPKTPADYLNKIRLELAYNMTAAAKTDMDTLSKMKLNPTQKQQLGTYQAALANSAS